MAKKEKEVLVETPKNETAKEKLIKENKEKRENRPEKISEEHLENLQRLVNAVNGIQYNVGKLEQQKHTLLHNLSITQDRIGVFQETLKKEYGTFDINIEDGKINHPETPGA
tara:strand:- start:682 stop:1017 length:336 start_codon:yes stop_codon:yes gene_type:complete